MKGILYMDVSMFEDTALFEKGLSLITEERKQKILKFKNPMPARLSLGAGVLLRVALERHGLEDKIAEIKKGEHGKPYLEKTDCFFSLSHSGRYAVCAFSDTPLGVDLQQIKEKIPAKTTRILSEEENAYLEKLNEEERIETFYRLWARKESLIKWDGRGLRLPLAQLSFVKDGKLLDFIEFDDKTLFFREYQEFLQEYTLCICNEDVIFPDKLEKIDCISLKNP